MKILHKVTQFFGINDETWMQHSNKWSVWTRFVILPLLAWGLYALNVWAVLVGLILVILDKMWFLDRMVWVYEDMKYKSEEYLSWEY
ncbi:MAG: hypothetical protein ACI9H6_000783 [Patiriisocius sp.]|jgi:hypothetical protein